MPSTEYQASRDMNTTPVYLKARSSQASFWHGKVPQGKRIGDQPLLSTPRTRSIPIPTAPMHTSTYKEVLKARSKHPSGSASYPKPSALATNHSHPRQEHDRSPSPPHPCIPLGSNQNLVRPGFCPWFIRQDHRVHIAGPENRRC